MTKKLQKLINEYSRDLHDIVIFGKNKINKGIVSDENQMCVCIRLFEYFSGCYYVNNKGEKYFMYIANEEEMFCEGIPDDIIKIAFKAYELLNKISIN